MRRHACLALFLLGLASLASAPPRESARPEPRVQYNRDIRPILADTCYACHGPDKAKRKADLRLDTEEGAFSDLGGHFALVAGKPDESTLVKRILEKDPARRMPPAASGKSLKPEQIALLRRWIEQGAKWQAHWSLLTPTRPTVPRLPEPSPARNAIDNFLLERLQREGFIPSPEADRRTLIRRLSFDLIGLPPTPEEVDAFLADKRPDAYEKLVERLLASNHFGERMALHWLDLVRYADSGGYHSDNARDVYLYRDYVIDAFNKNKPFDRFTIENLAGDLLPDAGAEQKIASGYNRLLQTTEEGGAQAKEYTAKYAADRVRNLSSVWLGLTLGCCECHSHKFDPFTLKEFYQLASFFADVQEVAVGRQPQTKIPTPEQILKLQAVKEQLTARLEELTTSTPALEAGQKKWEEAEKIRLASAAPDWQPVRPTRAESSAGSKLVVQEDRSVLSTGANPARDNYTLTLTVEQEKVTALRLTALPHPGFPGSGLSRGNGNFVLTGIEIVAHPPKGPAAPVKLSRALADYSQPGYPVESLLGKPKGAGWAVEGHVRQGSRSALFVFAGPLSAPPGTTLTVKLAHQSASAQHNIGRFRLDLTSSANPGLGDKGGLPPLVLAGLAAEPAKRTQAQKEALTAHYHSIAPELQAIRARIAALEKDKAALLAAQAQTLISMSGPPRVVRVLRRGNWLDDSGEIVQPDTPKSLPPLGVNGRRATRLDLARWLTSRDNPLVARVFVNRLWKLYFGQGLVTTADDFGAQGAWPSHPELLDWLAVEFRESGWDVKHMVQLMVTSAAYRQTSVAPETVRLRDPANRLLARQSRFRLDAELVRDNALAVSGLLSSRTGGASTKPYQPEGYWQFLNFPTRTWVEDRDENQYRRGLYTWWQRTFPHPSLVAFDAPSREECTVDRPRSNTPLQALALLNDPTYVEASRALAEKVLLGGKTDPERLDLAYRRVLGRKPKEEERQVLLALVSTHRAQYQADPKSADELLGIGLHPVSPEVDRPALAAWMSATRVLLNLHETITRE
jgi:mono/diheme cytochrome c family protein